MHYTVAVSALCQVLTRLCFRCSLGKYIGSRPVKLRKSTWQERDVKTIRKKEKKEKKMVQKLAEAVAAPDK